MKLEEAKIVAKELHHPIIKNFERRKVIVWKRDEIWGSDLCQMPTEKGYKFILTIIDIFTKYGWAIPIKNKQGDTVSNAFENVFTTSKRKPEYIWVDRGKEYYNQTFKSLLDNYNIQIYSTDSELKNSVIERWNRTLKDSTEREITAYKIIGKHVGWLDILPTIVKQYNNRVHRTIKLSPIDAIKDENLSKLEDFWIKRNLESPKNTKPKFKIGDIVRIYRYKGIFEKGYKKNWTDEKFKIKTIKDTNPITYLIEDLDGEEIQGAFYSQELLKSESF
jgi:hypothetical protein